MAQVITPDIQFWPADATATSPGDPNAMLYTLGATAGGDVAIQQAGFYLTQAGVMSSETGKTRILSLIEKTMTEGVQTVNANTPLISIDLNLGSKIILNQSASTIIQFSNLPTEGLRFFEITRIHDNTSNVYTLEFIESPPTYSWLTEGATYLTLTQSPNVSDSINGWVDSAGNVVTRMPILGFSLPTSRRVSTKKRVPNFRDAPQIGSAQSRNFGVNPFAVGVEKGQMITTGVDGSLYLTSVITDGIETITNPILADSVKIVQRNVRHTFMDAASTLNINIFEHDFISLNHNVNIDTFTVNGGDPDLSTSCIIWRIKDDNATPRKINFDREQFAYDIDPLLTQSALGVDMIYITCKGGVNTLAVFNYFG